MFGCAPFWHYERLGAKIQRRSFENNRDHIWRKLMKRSLLNRNIIGALFVGLMVTALPVSAETPTVIEFLQIPCQFVESENGVDHGFQSTQKSDCEAINKKSGDQRLAAAKVLKLKPGKYIFRVANKDVPYPLGFWLRGEGLGRLTLPSVSGGGLVTGATKDYNIDLKAGDYLYSCPLNSTPDYRIKVEG
jgi:hypothetical protein